MQPTARASAPKRIWGTLQASCRSTAMADIPRSPSGSSRSLSRFAGHTSGASSSISPTSHRLLPRCCSGSPVYMPSRARFAAPMPIIVAQSATSTPASSSLICTTIWRLGSVRSVPRASWPKRYATRSAAGTGSPSSLMMAASSSIPTPLSGRSDLWRCLIHCAAPLQMAENRDFWFSS